jgi:N-hydroxyarylamine O-acetyltransferase
MMNRNPLTIPPEPALSLDLVERVVTRLGLREQPTLDLAGLNLLYGAFSGHVPFDNVQKRIWFAGPQTTPLPGSDPSEFFNNFLKHGTGGTCWPINGGLYALLRAVGFEASRIVGSVVVDGYPQGANHGSVVVTLDGTPYLVDGWMVSFKVLPLIPGVRTSTGDGIHDIHAVPTGNGFEIISYPGFDREHPLPFRPEPEYDPVNHSFFLSRADRTRTVGFFNDSLFICRHFSESILTLGRNNKIRVTADGTLTKSEVGGVERRRSLIKEFGLSEEIVEALPPDVPGGVAPPGL